MRGRIFFKVIFVIAAGLLLGLGASPSSAKGRRVAVVVGISHYFELGRSLANPASDAATFAKILQSAHGFSPTEIHALIGTQAEPVADTQITDTWQAAVDTLDGNDVIVFFFAGHGIELKGRNYLLPSKVDKEFGKVSRTAVDFQRLIEMLGKRQESHPEVTGVFVLDACRENPYAWDGELRDEVPVGLAASSFPPTEIFIMYSAGIGQKAFDAGKGGVPSAFMKALTEELAKPDLSLSDLARAVKSKVLDDEFLIEHGELQSPAFYDQLSDHRTIGGASQPRRVAFSNKKLPHKWRFDPFNQFLECSQCPEMIVLPDGKFQRGDVNVPHAVPVTEVQIKKFAIGKFEVTNEQWDACVNDEKAKVHCGGSLKTARSKPAEGLKPVANVTWNDVQTYTAWLSETTGQRYRLATEAEWEYAARAGTTTTYPFGDTNARKQLCDYANGADHSVGALSLSYQFCDDNSGRDVTQVGRYRPNAWKIHDMIGNVWEWVGDCWQDSYAVKATAPAAGACELRAVRGGSWRSGYLALRSAARNAFAPNHSRATLGFRVVREIAE